MSVTEFHQFWPFPWRTALHRGYDDFTNETWLFSFSEGYKHFFYKSISLVLLFYQNFIEIIIDLFDENEKLQNEKLVKFINLSCFKILSKEKWDPY